MKLYIRNEPCPITGKRCNEFNEKFSKDVIKDLQNSYFREKHRKIGKKNQQIIDCYNKARLCYELYSCLVEEDEERMRECVQRLADERLNEIICDLIDQGYVF